MLDDRRREIDLCLPKPLTDGEWHLLVSKGYVEDAEWHTPDGGAAGAAQYIREIRQAVGGRPRSAPGAEPPPPGWQQTRIEVLALKYAQMAERNSGVQHLRRKLDREARRAQENPTEASPGALGRLDEAELVGWLTARYYGEWGVEVGDNKGAHRALLSALSAGQQVLKLWYWDRDGVGVMTVRAKGTLGEIAKVAQGLSDTYRWQRWEATRWLLCGGRPPQPVLVWWRPLIRKIGRDDSTTRLEMVVDPTLSPSEVAAAYERARKRMFPRHRLRPLSAKSLERARFYLERLKVDDSGEQWEHWRKEWNDQHGSTLGRYPSTDAGRSHFRRDLREALRRLVYVGWRMP